MHVYAVHELTTYLRELFESDPHLADVWIEDERGDRPQEWQNDLKSDHSCPPAT